MRVLITLILLIVLAGCQSMYQSSEQKVSIAENVTFDLITTVPFKDGLKLTQSATAQYKDDSHDLIFQTEIIEGRLTMVGLTPTGTRLFTIIMHDGIINAEGLSAMVDQIKPQYLLADLQLSLWPQQQVQQALSAGATISSGLNRRIISYNQKPIIDIEYSKQPSFHGNITFTHLERGYSLQIEPISIDTAVLSRSREQ